MRLHHGRQKLTNVRPKSVIRRPQAGKVCPYTACKEFACGASCSPHKCPAQTPIHASRLELNVPRGPFAIGNCPNCLNSTWLSR